MTTPKMEGTSGLEYTSCRLLRSGLRNTLSQLCAGIDVDMTVVCHRARMEVIRAVLKSRGDGSALAVPPQAVEKCVFVLASNGEFRSALTFVNKREHEERNRLTSQLVDGVIGGDKSLVDSGVVQELVRLVSHGQPSEVVWNKLAGIVAIHGISKTEGNEKLIRRMKNHVSNKLKLIGVLRKLKSERDFVWSLYEELLVESPAQSEELLEYMSTVLAVNGWYHRVSVVIGNTEEEKLKDRVGSRLIRAFNHFKHSPDLGLDQEVNAIVVRTVSGGSNAEVKAAVAEFYTVNEKWVELKNLIDFTSENLSWLPPRLVGKILKVTKGDTFFAFLVALKPRILDVSACNTAVDRAIEVKSARRLVDALEIIYLRKFAIGAVQLSKVLELGKNIQVPPRVRKRLTHLIDLIQKQMANS